MGWRMGWLIWLGATRKIAPCPPLTRSGARTRPLNLNKDLNIRHVPCLIMQENNYIHAHTHIDLIHEPLMNVTYILYQDLQLVKRYNLISNRTITCVVIILYFRDD